MSKKTVKAGTLLLVSHGAYSSYHRVGWFMVVKSFRPDDELSGFLNGKDPNEYGGFRHEEYLAALIRKGLLAEVDEFFHEYHLGDYGKAAEVQYLGKSN